MALGISAPMVTKLAKRGMPTDKGVEAAARWRRRHLEPARSKGLRAGTERTAIPIGDVSTLIPAHAITTLLRRVEELSMLASDALAGGSWQFVAPILRQALQAVPSEARPQVRMPLEVWDALTADLPGGGGNDPDDLSDEFMGVFWYQIALGERTDHALVGCPPLSLHVALSAPFLGTGG